MSRALTLNDQKTASYADTNDYVTIGVNGQLFGIPVLQVHDVLKPMRLTRVPLAPPEIAGVLNLRGRIVTAIDLRARLNLPPVEQKGMSVVVEHKGELYSLRVDHVGEVMSCPAADFQPPPPTLDREWLHVSDGVYRLQGMLLVILNIARLLDFADAEEE